MMFEVSYTMWAILGIKVPHLHCFLFFCQGYERILNNLEQTRDRRHVLKEYYEKVKDILQGTTAISREEKRDFLSGAEKCIADLKSKRYTLLIAGKKTYYFRCHELDSWLMLIMGLPF